MWKHPPNEFSINSNKVDIWKIDLDVDESLRKHLLTHLSTDETERANRFKFTRDYERYISARGILRAVLGQYLKADPADIVFDYGKHGKPFLRNSGGLEFNISHSANLAVFAFTKNCQIGIDLEFIRRNIEIEDIAVRFFSKNEVKKLLKLPEEERFRGFFNC
jgi:4'-phosphopantetheinyl transferase